MNELISEALRMPAIFEMIGIKGAFMAELKRLWQKEQTALPSYIAVGRVLNKLKEHKSLREKGKSLLENLPRNPQLKANSGKVYSIAELFVLKEFLYYYGRLQLFELRNGLFDKPLIELDSIFKYLDPQGSNSPIFHLNPAFSERLGSICKDIKTLESKLQKSIQAHFELALKQLQICSEGYQIIVPRSDKILSDKVMHSSHWVLVSESVANLRFQLADDEPSLKLKQQLQALEQERSLEEERVLIKISRHIHKQLPLINRATKLLHSNALSFMLADFGLRHSCVIPSIGGSKIAIKAAVNLALQQHLHSQKRQYQPIDLTVESRACVITGPNMGGKSCALQTLGQLCLMAKYHIPLPCQSAKLPKLDNIWMNRSEKNQSSDLSSFGSEVVAFNEALAQDGISLILLDEFARGTNPAEGEALLCAVLKYLNDSPYFVVAATHFSAPALLKELDQFTIEGPKLDLAKIPETAQQRLKLLAQKMDYRLKKLKVGQLPPQSAISIARLLGMKKEILKLIEHGTDLWPE